jgi:hypothetical protein
LLSKWAQHQIVAYQFIIKMPAECLYQIKTSVWKKGTFTIIKPAPYLNSKLFKNNEIEEVTTSYEADGTTINSQSTSISTHKYNEAGYITKTSFSGGASRTYELEKIN